MRFIWGTLGMQKKRPREEPLLIFEVKATQDFEARLASQGQLDGSIRSSSKSSLIIKYAGLLLSS